MHSFRDWLVVDEVLRETKESILADLATERATRSLFEFLHWAIGGGLRPILEDSEEAEFRSDGSWTEAKAQEIQNLANKVRWSAMIDRAEAVEFIRDIYEKKWVSYIEDRKNEMTREYEAERKSGMHTSDEEIRRAVGAKFKMTTYEVGRIIAGQQNEWAVFGEDKEKKWVVPTFKDDDDDDDDDTQNYKSLDERLDEIITKVEPALVKLEYLKRGQLSFGEQKDKAKAIDMVIRSAAAETGNEVEENETTNLLKTNEGEREKARRSFMEAIYEAYGKIAASAYYRTSKYMGSLGKDSAGTKGGRRGSQDFQGAEDILSQGIEGVMKMLTRRKPERDGVAPPWKDIKVLSGSTVPEIMGSIAVRFRPPNISRDSKRDRSKAGGQSGSSSGNVQNLGDGATQDDGTRGSIDPADAKASDSLSSDVAVETNREMGEAFKKSMHDLKVRDPLLAMLVCLRMGLGCHRDGNMPDTSVSAFMTLASGVGGFKSTQTPENFLSRLGQGDNPSSKMDEDLVVAIQGGNYWDSLKKTTRFASSPKDESGALILQKPQVSSPHRKTWEKFVATARDAKNEAMKWLAKRMYELMGEDSHERSQGQTGPTSWSMSRLLKNRFGRSAEIKETNHGRGVSSIVISFIEGRKVSKYFEIEATPASVSITGPVYPEKMKSGAQSIEDIPDIDFEMPDLVECPKCGGSDSDCSVCDGTKAVIDPKALREMEFKILDHMIRGTRIAPRKDKA